MLARRIWRGDSARHGRALATLLVSVVAVLLVPSAALAATGAISGQMTNGKVGVAGEVEIFEFESPLERVKTDASGNYTATELSEGTSYQVEFIPQGKYVPIFYTNATTLAAATAVSVKSAVTTGAINGVVSEEARIQGKVTDSKGTPLEFAEVEAETPAGEYVDGTVTDEEGEYTIERLPPGTYAIAIERFATNGIERRFYHGKETLGTAQLQTVLAGEVLGGIDEALPALGAITGTVTDSEGHGVERAIVELFEGSTRVAQEYTKAGGTYEIPNLLPGSFTVRFAPPEHGNFLPQYYDDKQTALEATPVSVASGASVSAVDARLETAGAITGTVTSATGAPVAKAQILLWNASRTTYILYTETAADGTYSLPGLTTGTYYLEVSAFGYERADYRLRTTLSDADPISVTTGSVTASTDVTLAPQSNQTASEPLGGTGQITGQATEPGGAPVDEAVASLLNSQGRTIAQATTIADGTYAFAHLPAGTYHVEFEAGDGQNLAPSVYGSAVNVAAATLTPGVSAQLQVGGTVAGTVTGASAGDLAGIEVTAYRSGAGGAQVAGAAVTGASGEYKILGLASGSYEVRFTNAFDGGADWVTQYYDASPTLSGAAPVSVSEGHETTGIDATLAQGGRLAGTVTRVGGGAVSGVRVEVLTPEGEYVAESDTLESGAWEVGDLAPGNYIVSFVPEGQNLVAQYYQQADSEGAARQVTATAGTESGGIDASLAAGSELSGKDNAGESYVSVLDKAGVTVARVRTNASGEYSVRGLPEGAYTAHFEPLSFQNLIPQYYHAATTFTAATFVQISPTSPGTEIDATMEEGAGIVGTVTGTGGEGVGGVRVIAFDEEANKVSAASTTATGHYSVSGLPAGSYRLEFVPEAGSGHGPSYYSKQATLTSATAIVLKARQQVTGINESLGGESGSPTSAGIEGIVTGAAGTPLSGVEVLALNETGEALASTATGIGGGYVLADLAPGSYFVEFQPPSPDEVSTFYPGVPSFSEAKAVQATAGSVSAGIDVRLGRFSEEPLARAIGGGTTGLGTVASIGPARTSTAPTPSSAGVPTLTGARKLVVSAGKLELELACAYAGPCAGSLSLLAYLTKRGALSPRSVKGGRTAVLDRVGYRISAGGHVTLKLRLSALGTRLLSAARSGAPVRLVLAPTLGKSQTLALTLVRSTAKPNRSTAKPNKSRKRSTKGKRHK